MIDFILFIFYFLNDIIFPKISDNFYDKAKLVQDDDIYELINKGKKKVLYAIFKKNILKWWLNDGEKWLAQCIQCVKKTYFYFSYDGFSKPY